MELDVSNLINKAQDLLHDGMMSFARKGTVKIQEFTADNGDKYLMELTMTFMPPEDATEKD
jgi:hypothetical protein